MGIWNQYLLDYDLPRPTAPLEPLDEGYYQESVADDGFVNDVELNQSRTTKHPIRNFICLLVIGLFVAFFVVAANHQNIYMRRKYRWQFWI